MVSKAINRLAGQMYSAKGIQDRKDLEYRMLKLNMEVEARRQIMKSNREFNVKVNKA